MNVLKALRKEITDSNPAANTWFLCQESKYQTILDMKNIIPPPMADGYRNKCEFTIGKYSYSVSPTTRAPSAAGGAPSPGR